MGADLHGGATGLNEPGRMERYSATGDRVVVRWRYSWGSGHIRGVDLFRVRDEKVAEKLSYVKG